MDKSILKPRLNLVVNNARLEALYKLVTRSELVDAQLIACQK
jgi:hypothetical protein